MPISHYRRVVLVGRRRKRRPDSSLVLLGVDMRSDCRYAPPRAGHTGEGRPFGRRKTWWFQDGVRFAEHSGTVFGWVLGWTGKPSRCDSWPAELLRGSDPRAVLEGWAMSLLRKGDKRVQGAVEEVRFEDDRFAQGYPLLWSFLSQSLWGPDDPRETGSLLLFRQDGVFKAMLRDPNDSTCLWVAGRTLSGVFDAAEGSLGDPGADWRMDRKKQGDQAKRVTKK